MPKTKPKAKRAKARGPKVITPVGDGTAASPMSLSATRRELFAIVRKAVQSTKPHYAFVRDGVAKADRHVVIISAAEYERLTGAKKAVKPARAAQLKALSAKA